MEWLDTIFSSVSILSLIGGTIGALRASIKDKKPLPEKIIDVATGVIASIAITDYFTPGTSPKLALAISMISGSIFGQLMDTIQAMSPNIARGIIDVILNKYGYTKSNYNEYDSQSQVPNNTDITDETVDDDDINLNERNNDEQ